MDQTARASFEKAVIDEQISLAAGSPLRLWASLAWLASLVALRIVRDSALVHAILPLAIGNAAYAVCMAVGRRLSGRPLPLLYSLVVVDVPLAGLVGYVWGNVPGESRDFACGMTVTLCVLLVFAPTVILNGRVLLAAMLSSEAVVLSVFAHFDQPVARIVFAMIAVGLAGLAGRMLLRHALRLIHRAWEHAEARVKEADERNREVRVLNEELRRQVAERSRELTEALARSEGDVAPAALVVGETFDGRYRVTRSLGRGGMGAVYEVERTRDGKKLALKVVTGATSAKHAARFAREAEIGARLQHENLVSIVDVGIAAGATPFLVMELVQGGSLEDKRGRFGDAAWAMPIVQQIAAGLAELHANRIVHRDLKPGNVLLVESDDGSPALAKISDFGISRFGAIDDSGDADVEGAAAHPGAAHAGPRDLTETGALMGTPVYMPPEAWFGPAKHPSADVFSLGVLAYEALTGSSPFPVPPVLLVRARQPIPSPAPLDGVDARVASLVLACLRVEPANRPRAREIAEALAHGPAPARVSST